MKKDKWKRNCPNPNNNSKCKKFLTYSTEDHLNRANKNNSLCKSCSMFRENNNRYEKSNYDIWLEKYGREEANKKQKKYNEKMSGKNHHFYGKKRPEHSERMKGKNNPMFGKKRPEHSKWMKENNSSKRPDVRRKLSESHKGKIVSKETKNKMSERKKGKNNFMYGHSVYSIWLEKYGKEDADRLKKLESKNKRLSYIKRIKKLFGQYIPNYNPNAIPILESAAKQININDLMHAENGGEFQYRGYFADGYSKSTNTWFEYYEKHHERRKEKDEIRKQEIINYLDCKFVEIKEWEL